MRSRACYETTLFGPRRDRNRLGGEFSLVFDDPTDQGTGGELRREGE